MKRRDAEKKRRPPGSYLTTADLFSHQEQLFILQEGKLIKGEVMQNLMSRFKKTFEGDIQQ